MKRKRFFSLICLLTASFIFVLSCYDPVGDPVTYVGLSLADYQKVGASVAAREYTENYDCSNFSVQFYQNCYKAGFPCRVRSGISGGNQFGVGNHAWNSVKIDGKWVNWEPQLNDVYDGHRQMQTPVGNKWGTIYQEDLARMLYEYVGRYVPEALINLHEIDSALYPAVNSPFYPIFAARAYCLSDDLEEMQPLISQLEDNMIDAWILVLFNNTTVFYFFKYNDKYYGIEDLQAHDSFEGRSSDTQKSIKDFVNSGADFTVLDIDISY